MMGIGEVLAGRYEIEELLGVGGMSRVYRARDRVLDRDVALKVLHERYSGDPGYVERFRREARAIARLSHPNIVTVIDRGEFEGRQYIVFEHVRGQNLKDVLAAGRGLPVGEALALAHQAARGLAFAHEQGIVHRDVKPQNVLVDREGVAKVTDFGIARALDGEEGLTETGTVLGTTDYIAPEQAVGGRADERSDQYSLGVLLYELLTGDVPYRGDSIVTVAMRHVHDPVPSVRAKRDDVSPRIDALVRRAMAKRPEDRFPSLDALVAALEACMAEEAARRSDGGATEVLRPVPSARAPRRRAAETRPRPTLARLLAGLALVAAGAALLAALVTGRIALGDDAGGAPVRLRAVADYDPQGGDGEHPELVVRATDRDRSTYWTTETYRSFEKQGVGIVVATRRPRTLAELTVVTDTPGFRALVEAGDSPSGPFDPVSAERTVHARTTFELDGDGHRYYLLWITDLEGAAHVNELRAR